MSEYTYISSLITWYYEYRKCTSNMQLRKINKTEINLTCLEYGELQLTKPRLSTASAHLKDKCHNGRILNVMFVLN